MFDTEVLIVGAGPTGLTLAASLAARHLDHLVVDAQPEGANTSRAAAINAHTLEVLEELDVSRRLVKAGLQLPRFTVRDHDRTLMEIDFSTLPTVYPYTLALPQSHTESLLLERVLELGGSVSRPRTLVEISQDSDGVTAAMDDGSSVRARFAVGADGMRSTVRQAAGIGFGGSEYAESFLLADVRLAGEAPDDQVILFWAKAGLTVVAPMPDGIYRIVAPMVDAPETPSVRLVQDLLDDRGLGAGRTVVTELIWGSRFRIHHRVADTYRAGRLLLAGDAAHVHSPAGGQGMNLGIQDAAALGDALAQSSSGSDAALDAYGPSRRAIAGQVLALTGRLTTLATMPAGVRPVRNLVIGGAGHVPAVRRGLAMRLSGLVYR
jgi:2-polyprenyl-6-methoxyphenol hydroxylase-like FAD-dependent oxidoreductase